MSVKIIAFISILLVAATFGGLGASSLNSMINEQNDVNSDLVAETRQSEPKTESFTESISKLFFSSST